MKTFASHHYNNKKAIAISKSYSLRKWGKLTQLTELS